MPEKLKADKKCWRNSAGEAASMESRNRQHFGLRPFFRLMWGGGGGGTGRRKEEAETVGLEGRAGKGRGRMEKKKGYLKLEKSMLIPLGCRLTKRNTQACLVTIFTAGSSCKSEFLSDLYKAFIDAGIPPVEIGKQTSQRFFLEKYTEEPIPSESSLRKNYVDSNFNIVVQKIRDEVASNKIWMSIDETTDAVGSCVANVVIGTLETGQPSQEYLLTLEVLEKPNSSTIAQLFTSSFAEDRKYENELFVTEAAPYMKKAVHALNVWGTWLFAVLYYAANCENIK